MLGECVMAMYGIARSLESRQLGPAQLLPPIEDFLVSSQRACPVAKDLIRVLRARAKTPVLQDAARQLGDEFDRVSAEVKALFARATKLDARERLDLERNIDQVGGELQAAHRLIGVMAAATKPRPIQLSLSDLVRGHFGAKAAFVERRIELCVRASEAARFESDPQVAWAVVECFLHDLPEGVSTFFATLEARDDGTVLIVGDTEDMARSSLMRASVDLGPRLAAEPAIVGAIMRDVGWTRSQRDAEVQIAFAAA